MTRDFILHDELVHIYFRLNDYSPSGIWDIMEVPGELIQSKSKIAYQIRIRR